MSKKKKKIQDPTFVWLVGCYHNGILRTEVAAVEINEKFIEDNAPPVPDTYTGHLQEKSKCMTSPNRDQEIPVGSGWQHVFITSTSAHAAIMEAKATHFANLIEDEGDRDIVISSDGETWSQVDYTTVLRLDSEQYAELENGGEITNLHLRSNQKEVDLADYISNGAKQRLTETLGKAVTIEDEDPMFEDDHLYEYLAELDKSGVIQFALDMANDIHNVIAFDIA